MSQTLIKLLRPRTVSFWGVDHSITPRLCDKVFGDGKLVIAFVPLNTRPERYVVRIDSMTDLDSDAWLDQIDEVYDALEDEFGKASFEDDDGEWQHEDWPAVDGGSGCAWHELVRMRKPDLRTEAQIMGEPKP